MYYPLNGHHLQLTQRLREVKGLAQTHPAHYVAELGFQLGRPASRGWACSEAFPPPASSSLASCQSAEPLRPGALHPALPAAGQEGGPKKAGQPLPARPVHPRQPGPRHPEPPLPVRVSRKQVGVGKAGALAQALPPPPLRGPGLTRGESILPRDDTGILLLQGGKAGKEGSSDKLTSVEGPCATSIVPKSRHLCLPVPGLGGTYRLSLRRAPPAFPTQGV